MQLGRYQVSTLKPTPILSITFSNDGRHFAVAGESGYEIWRTWPLGLIRRRSVFLCFRNHAVWLTGMTDTPGTLGLVLPIPHSPLLVLQGGGSSPLYPPNKAVIYHDAPGVAVAELEFGERIRGIATRTSNVIIALSRRVIAFEYGLGDGGKVSTKGKGKATDTGFWIRKIGEWETVENDFGLIAVATTPGSTLLALPGRQAGHVQLVHLPPCPFPPSQRQPPAPNYPPQPFRSPIILAHTHSLSALSTTASGSHIITTSERGTLLRIWDTSRGRLVRELRRGVDPANMWGIGFEDFALGIGDGQDRKKREESRQGGRVVGWSDKGTVHVWDHSEEERRFIESTKNRSSPTAHHPPSFSNLLSRNLPLPKYFTSSPSFAQYHLPRKNPHAFSSVVSAAAGSTISRLDPNTRSEAERESEEKELAERFVVCWIEVDVDIPERDGGVVESHDTIRLGKGSPTPGTTGIGIGMGTREERRSFGSDATSTRTATPTNASILPKPRPESLISTYTHATIREGIRRSSSGSSKVSLKSTKTTVGKEEKVNGTAKKTRKERQLVAITYSGDWYRLRLPDEDDDEDEKRERGKKCELVEYRRLRVGGGGW